jgi:hypothetical protein
LEQFEKFELWGIGFVLVKGDRPCNIAILAGVVNFLPHPNPPLIKGRE